MIIVKCDRCGKEWQGYDQNGLTLGLKITSAHEYIDTYDLCNECIKELRKWVKRGKKR